MAKKTALLVGATGLIGNQLLRLLLNNDLYDLVIVLSRRPIKDLESKKLMVKLVNFEEIENITLPPVDDFFCTLGTTMKQAGSKEIFYKIDFDYPIMSAKLALKHQAKRSFLVTAMGADANAVVYYNRVKGKVEEAILGLAFQDQFIFRPSLLLGNREKTRFGESMAQLLAKSLSFLFIGVFKQYKAIEGKDVAKAMNSIAVSSSSGINIYSSIQIQEIADNK